MESILNYFKTSLYILFVYLGIETGIVKVLFWMMVLDSVFGVIKALRLGQKFSFKILGWGMVTKLTMLVVPMVLALMGKGLSFDFNYFVVAVLNILIVNEGISCITNMISIKTGKKVENTDYITRLLEVVRKALAAMLHRLFSVLENPNNVNQKK